jgi:Sulfotransferase family
VAEGAARDRRTSVRQVFVVTLARSGSTLLRYLLDAHPDVTSPPELNLSALLQHAADTWHRSLDAISERPPDEPIGPIQSYSPEAYQRARRAVDPIMVRCANIAGASVFCDKSLTTVDHLATVSRCYPKASYIFLYRYPLDLIASGIEASRWGFNAFGFAPYVGATPGNFVAGLGNYWIDKVTKMVEFERTCSVAHARIYYELLCDDPAGTVEQLLKFLELSPDAGIVERMFGTEHGRGPGDYKIDYTGSINANSIGRGSVLPETFLPGQVQRIDELLAELDYPPMQASRRGDLATLLGLKGVTDSRSVDDTADRVSKSLVETLSRAQQALPGDRSPVRQALEVILRGNSGVDTHVTFDPHLGAHLGRASESDSDRSLPRIRCQGDVLLRAAAGDVNLAQAAHDGEVRVELPDGANPVATRAVLKGLASLLRAGWISAS